MSTGIPERSSRPQAPRHPRRATRLIGSQRAAAKSQEPLGRRRSPGNRRRRTGRQTQPNVHGRSQGVHCVLADGETLG